MNSLHDELARWFNVPGIPVPARPRVPKVAPPGAGELLLLTGASGSGKSSILRAVARGHPRRVLRLKGVRSAAVVLRLFEPDPLDRSLPLLARVGLAEAPLLLRGAHTLSMGERFRLSLALLLRDAAGAEPGTLLVMDEFTSTLDEASAQAVARTVRRALDEHRHLAAAIATWREGLVEILAPTVHIRCDFGQWEVTGKSRKSEAGNEHQSRRNKGGNDGNGPGRAGQRGGG